MKISHYILLFLLVILISACNNTTEPTSSYPYPIDSNAYPYPGQDTYSGAYPYPGAESSLLVATVGPIPSPGKDSGVVTGRILNNNQPQVNAILYLAQIISDEEGNEMAAAINLTDSPRCYTNPDGTFVFSNIPPGRYALVLNTVMAEYLLSDPNDTKMDLLFVVEAGETLDLGELNYTDLPSSP